MTTDFSRTIFFLSAIREREREKYKANERKRAQKILDQIERDIVNVTYNM